MHQNAQICMLKLFFSGAIPRIPTLGRSYGAPPQTLPARHFSAAPRSGLRPLSRLPVFVRNITCPFEDVIKGEVTLANYNWSRSVMSSGLGLVLVTKTFCSL